MKFASVHIFTEFALFKAAEKEVANHSRLGVSRRFARRSYASAEGPDSLRLISAAFAECLTLQAGKSAY